MARSRSDELLEGWKMIARNAHRPLEAPRPRTRRSSGPLGLIAAGAVAIVLVIALALRGSGPGPQPSQPAVGASPTNNASPSTVASPSPTPSPAGSPSSAPSPVGSTPAPFSLASAEAIVDEYTNDLVHARYMAAWGLLAPDGPAHEQTFASWSTERSQFFKSVAGRYTVGPQPAGNAPLSNWLASPWAASIDQARAVLIEVDYPALAGNNAGYNLYIVNPTASGLEIYDVR